MRQAVVDQGVIESHRSHLHLVRKDTSLLEIAQQTIHHIVLDKKDAGDNVGRISHPDGLVIPDYVVNVKGDLLLGFEGYNLGDLLGLDRR